MVRKRILGISILCLIALITAGIPGSHYAQSADDSSLEKGLQWLRELQNEDGSWTYSGGESAEENVGVTSMATLAFLNHGIDESDPAVGSALAWILSWQEADGSITNGHYEVYDTSLAALALVAARNNDYYDEIQSAVAFLSSIQNDEDTGYSESDPYYGGWPYSQGQDD